MIACERYRIESRWLFRYRGYRGITTRGLNAVSIIYPWVRLYLHTLANIQIPTSKPIHIILPSGIILVPDIYHGYNEAYLGVGSPVASQGIVTRPSSRYAIDLDGCVVMSGGDTAETE